MAFLELRCVLGLSDPRPHAQISLPNAQATILNIMELGVGGNLCKHACQEVWLGKISLMAEEYIWSFQFDSPDSPVCTCWCYIVLHAFGLLSHL